MAQFSHLFGHIGPIDTATLRSAQTLAQVSKKLGIPKGRTLRTSGIGPADRGERCEAAGHAAAVNADAKGGTNRRVRSFVIGSREPIPPV
jgi:hypothetical protein